MKNFTIIRNLNFLLMKKILSCFIYQWIILFISPLYVWILRFFNLFFNLFLQYNLLCFFNLSKNFILISSQCFYYYCCFIFYFNSYLFLLILVIFPLNFINLIDTMNSSRLFEVEKKGKKMYARFCLNYKNYIIKNLSFFKIV